MRRPELKTHDQLLPAYEDMPHLVRRIVREELEPVLRELEQLRREVRGSETLAGVR